MVLAYFLYVSAATWLFFFTGRMSADSCWKKFTHRWRSVWNWLLWYTSLVPPLKQPHNPPPYAVLQHLLIPVQRNSLSSTVGELHIHIWTQLCWPGKLLQNHYVVFTYLSMYIIPNTITYRHHDNWPTYNRKTAKNVFSSSKSPPTLCNTKCIKGEI